MSETDHLRELVRLQEEVSELGKRLDEAIRNSNGKDFPEKLLTELEEKSELFGLAVAHAYPEAVQRARTPEELEMLAFADRLAARQGTFIPDFDALYKKKANLDGKLTDP
jgi:hypothetical protein